MVRNKDIQKKAIDIVNGMNLEEFSQGVHGQGKVREFPESGKSQGIP